MTTSQTTTPTTDPRPVLRQALDQTGALIAGTDPSAATAPTPCVDYDVNGLIGHLQGVVRRIGVVLGGRHFSETSDLSSADWAADWAAGRAATDPVLDAADLDAPVTVPWGSVPARNAIDMWVGELAAHSWDLAAATGRVDQLDDSLAEAALPTVMATLPAEPRGGPIPFGPVVAVPDTASAYDRMLGWQGRDPQWSA